MPDPAEGIEGLSLQYTDQESDLRSSQKRDSTEMERGSSRGNNGVVDEEDFQSAGVQLGNAVTTKRRRTMDDI